MGNSFLGSQLGSTHGIMFGAFSSSDLVSFTDSAGTTTTDLEIISRAKATELRENGFNNLETVETWQIVVQTSQLSSIDPEGSFTDASGVGWDIDTGGDTGRGIESRTDLEIVVNLIRRDANTIGGMRVV